MATAMKINKEKYLAKCKEALAKYEAPAIEYKEALDKWKAESEAWGKKVIESKMLKMIVSSYNGDQTFYATGKMAESRPKRPEESDFYEKYGIKTYDARPAIPALKEVIALIEMTDSETIGVSVANKVSNWISH